MKTRFRAGRDGARRRGAGPRALSALLACVALAGLSSGCGARGAAAGEFEPARPGVLTVATGPLPQPGFWVGDRSGEPQGGFEFGLALALADRFGLDRVELVEVPFASIVAGELDGADLALAQITPTPERSELLGFSEPYMSANPAALVSPGTEVPDVKAARDLRWAVQEGTTLASILDEKIAPTRPVIEAPNQARAVRALRTGSVDAVLLDMPVALAIAAAAGGRLAVAAQIPVQEALSAGLPKGSQNREAVDSAVRAFLTDGTLSELASEWLGVALDDSSFAVENVPALRTE